MARSESRGSRGAPIAAVALQALLGASVGLVAFRVADGALSLCVLMLFFAWGNSTRAIEVFAGAISYFLAVSWGIQDAAVQYFPDATAPTGWILWLGYALPGAIMFTQLRPTGSAGRRMLLSCAALAVTLLPPIGVCLPGHPAYVAGELLPGTGATGIVATLMLCSVLLSCQHDDYRQVRVAGASCIGMLVIGFALRVQEVEPSAPEHVVAMDLVYRDAEEAATGSFGEYERLARLTRSIREGSPERATTVVLPEAISSPSSRARLAWWRQELSSFFEAGGIVVVGEASVAAGKSAARIGARTYDWTDARQTVPLAELRPWDINRGYQGIGSDAGLVLGARGERLNVVQCYEALVPWLLLRDSLDRFDLTVLQSNQWWARQEAIPETLAVHARLRARLYGVALTHARALRW